MKLCYENVAKDQKTQSTANACNPHCSFCKDKSILRKY